MGITSYSMLNENKGALPTSVDRDMAIANDVYANACLQT
jgi:hypothetical protein